MIYKRVFILPQDKELRDDFLEIIYHSGEYQLNDDRIVTGDDKVIKTAEMLELAIPEVV